MDWKPVRVLLRVVLNQEQRAVEDCPGGWRVARLRGLWTAPQNALSSIENPFDGSRLQPEEAALPGCLPSGWLRSGVD